MKVAPIQRLVNAFLELELVFAIVPSIFNPS